MILRKCFWNEFKTGLRYDIIFEYKESKEKESNLSLVLTTIIGLSYKLKSHGLLAGSPLRIGL